jgi:hypothetical protein
VRRFGTGRSPFDDNRVGLFSPRDATRWTKRTEIVGVGLCILGLHFRFVPVVLVGAVVLMGGGVYDLFCRRGPLVVKVIIAVVCVGLVMTFFNDPHHTWLWFQTFANGANRLLSPVGK